MRASSKNNPVQGFAPSRIETVTVLDTKGVEAIRIAEAKVYHINDDTGNAAIMPAGVTVIASTVAKITFASATVVEIMTP